MLNIISFMANKKIKIKGSEIEKLAKYGLTNVEIAEFFGISEASLRRLYNEFLTKGRMDVKIKLRRKQLAVAMNGNVTMLIWLGKQMLGQSEKNIENIEVKIIVERRIINLR